MGEVFERLISAARPFSFFFSFVFFSAAAADGDPIPPGVDWLVLAQRSLRSRHLLADQQPFNHDYFVRHQGLRECLLFFSLENTTIETAAGLTFTPVDRP